MKLLPYEKGKAWHNGWVDEIKATRLEERIHAQYLNGPNLANHKRRFFPVVVRESDKALICGRDRFAISYRRQKFQNAIRVHYVEASDGEAEALWDLDQYWAEPSRAHKESRLLKSYEALCRHYDLNPASGHVKEHQKRQSSYRAKETLLICTGWKPHSLQDYLRKARRRREGQRIDSNSRVFSGRPVELWGCELSEEGLLGLQAYETLMSDLIISMVHLERKITIYLGKRLPCTPEHLQHWAGSIKELRDFLRGRRLGGLCAYCKSQPQFQSGCVYCLGRGFMYKKDLLDCPAELQQDSPCLVVGPDGSYIEIGTDDDEQFMKGDDDDDSEANSGVREAARASQGT